ncbi:MOSC N-terminal beta barrel domain-containing protein [Marivita sp. GX14005]|uniref:MOSC domain-containing protein n=1 Tax=Marivita sp. GX14005 TaxID=2942276 RepID=UPI002018C3CD|nr:MOSC N-terminal beta barrel domain-containing protein [Marivita sp. GX14005]MCL3881097.1 MOSC domain-containing protein [Marivita sp. GX14005]
MAHVTGIWRHPIKSHGREPLDTVMLRAGEAMPFDRLWAVAHERSRADGTEWAHCGNFCRVAKMRELMAMTASYCAETSKMTLRIPGHDDLCFDPDTEEARFLDWISEIVKTDSLRPARLLRARGPAFTDSPFPSVTLCNAASHRAVESEMSRTLSHLRWRGNVWIEGLEPWEERDWLGREIRIGSVQFHVRELTERCKATHSNPATGKRDADILGGLETWGHQEFSVRAEVVRGGTLSINDEVAYV